MSGFVLSKQGGGGGSSYLSHMGKGVLCSKSFPRTREDERIS